MKIKILCYPTFISLLLLCIPALACDFPSGQRSANIVYLSDSHGLGPFGEALDLWLRQRDRIKAETWVVGGTAPWQWINPYTRWVSPMGYHDEGCSGSVPAPRRNLGKVTTPYLPTFLEKYAELSDKYIIIALGANATPNNEGFKFLQTNVTKVVKLVSQHNFKCIWIGPPRMRRWDNDQNRAIKRYEKIYQALIIGIEQASASDPESTCTLIDSRPISYYPAQGGDGIHFSMNLPEHRQAAKQWADEIILQLESLLN